MGKPKRRCAATTRTGEPCQNGRQGNSWYCGPHQSYKSSKKRDDTVDYHEYINSPEWRAKRQDFIKSPDTSNECYGCQAAHKTGFHLHHVTYERLGRERFEDLRMVCEPCHKAIHALVGRKFDIPQATEEIRRRKSGHRPTDRPPTPVGLGKKNRVCIYCSQVVVKRERAAGQEMAHQRCKPVQIHRVVVSKRSKSQFQPFPPPLPVCKRCGVEIKNKQRATGSGPPLHKNCKKELQELIASKRAELKK